MNKLLVVIAVLFGGGWVSVTVTGEATEQRLCSRISEIKVLPYRGEHVDDAVYNSLVEKGDKAVPCLIEQVTNTKLMPDPRRAPRYEGTTVGDVALFIF